ncbi:DUF4494 domain-containing protein [uncultured Sunxiuqinia sp.]|uniref:DUF4494 domain-containing protein n=1 Tax=uncultured Sunxiuqinia sp. TaxID=1573825 RepID=UPI0026122BF1|nr:DUF4494 domain-containing protein [uncultured Sunxiuqinia sp.]
MQTWFECKVKYVKVDQDGRERKVSEAYLVDAVSFTDAEARMIEQMQQLVRGGEFYIDNIKKSNVIEIFPHEDGEYWFKAKIGIVTIDEKAGKEKKINNYFLVAADDFKQALLRLEEDLSYILVPIQISAMNLSPIVDVFPYFKDEVNEPLPPHLKPIQTEEPVVEQPVVNEEFEGESAVEENEQPEEADEE